jgi:hypothetical protein
MFTDQRDGFVGGIHAPGDVRVGLGLAVAAC